MHTTTLWILLERTAPAYFDTLPPPRPPPPTPLSPDLLSWAHLKHGLAPGPARAPISFITRAPDARATGQPQPQVMGGKVHPLLGPPETLLAATSPHATPETAAWWLQK